MEPGVVRDIDRIDLSCSCPGSLSCSDAENLTPDGGAAGYPVSPCSMGSGCTLVAALAVNIPRRFRHSIAGSQRRTRCAPGLPQAALFGAMLASYRSGVCHGRRRGATVSASRALLRC